MTRQIRLVRLALACGWIVLGPATGASAQVTAFVHRAQESNIESNWTLLDHRSTNNRPEAIVVVTPNYNPGGGARGVYDTHALGVWYTNGKWAIFHQDRTPMIPGTAFNVLVAEPRELRLPDRPRDSRLPAATDREPAGLPERKVLADGKAEILYPDRTKVQAAEGATTVTRPDGSSYSRLRSQVQQSTPPIPADEMTQQWLERHGDDLLSVIRLLVADGDASIQNYLRFEGADLPLFNKIDKRRSKIMDLLSLP